MGDLKVIGGRRGGKTIATEKALAEYIKRNPNAVIIRHDRIEKPVHEIERPALTVDTDAPKR